MGIIFALLWRDVRVAEGARLESVCALTTYRGFESHSLRIFFQKIRRSGMRTQSPNNVRTLRGFDTER